MRIEAPRVELSDREATLVARFDPASLPGFDLRLSVGRALVGVLDVSCTPFVPIATVLATHLGEDVEADGPVSAQLAAGAEAAGELMAGWWAQRPARVLATRAEPGFAPGTAEALFYTRGVDSTCSFVRSRAGEIPERFTHFLGIADLDYWVSPEARAATWERTSRAAERLGLPIIRLTTNARAVVDPIVPWERSHGAVLGSVALSLGVLLHRVVIASTYPADADLPWGSHPALDPCWSTERTRIRHDGAELGRVDKVARIVGEPGLLRDLKVCWIGDTPGNCGRCVKCLKTMTILESLGALDPGLFDGELTRETILASETLGAQTPLWSIIELLDTLPIARPDVRDAWREKIFAEGILLPDTTPRGSRNGLELAGRALAEPDPFDALYEAAEAGYAFGTAALATADGVAIGWVGGRLPLRFPREHVHDRLAAVAAREHRPVRWCLVDEQRPATVALAERLAADWGDGICYLAGVPWRPEQDPGLPPAAVSGLLRASRMRLWWSDGDDLDPVRVLESAANGCVPVQAMPVGRAELLRPRLPHRLRALVVPVPDHGPIPEIDDETLASSLDAVTAELATGSLERDVVLAGA